MVDKRDNTYVISNSYNTSMRFVSDLLTRYPRVQPEGGTFTNQIQTEWICYNCFVLWCMSGSKVPLACVWHEKRFYTAGPMLRNNAGGLSDGKPWVSMLLSRNGFTMPTHVTNLAFVISTNVPLALLTS